jgi:nitroimidazol reductase NimA-like FMN-containing flavoprotein (pyridoxamine 5'-phosphate oxidase superfamily)
MPARLADAAIQHFLHSKDIALLATLQKDGAPLAMPMWFVADTDSLYMVSVTDTQKVRTYDVMAASVWCLRVGRGERQSVV